MEIQPALDLFNAQTPEEVQFCIDRGDNVNEYYSQIPEDLGRAYDGESMVNNFKKPINIASKNNNLAVFRVLVQNGADYGYDDIAHTHPLYDAVTNGSYNILLEYIQNLGFDVNDPILPNISCLDVACSHDNIDIVDLLLSYRASREGLDDDRPPLMSAIYHDNHTIVYKLLFEFLDDERVLPATLNRKNSHGTPIFFGCKSSTMLDILYSAGLEINMQNDNNQTLLHEVCTYNNKNIELLLKCLQYSADPNLPDYIGNTPFHNLMANNYYTPNILLDIQAIKYLVEYGGNINVLNKNGDTPLYLYFESHRFTQFTDNNIILIQTLIDLGASVDITNKKGFNFRRFVIQNTPFIPNLARLRLP